MKHLFKQSQFLVGAVNAFRKIPGDLRVIQWKLRRPALVEGYLSSHPVRKLHIGCGKNIHEGWLNTDLCPVRGDVVHLDATARFPFPSESFDYVFSEHMIEHVPYEAGQVLLRECCRILRPGGKIRISTPNLRNMVTLMSDSEGATQKQYIKRSSDRYIPLNTRYLPGFVLNNFFWDFWHYFVYDPDTLGQAFSEAGFEQVTQVEIGISSDPNLSNLESHAGVVGGDLNSFETMVLEATKGRAPQARG